MSIGVTVLQYTTHAVAANPTGSANQGFLNRVAKTTPSSEQPENVFYSLTDLPLP